MRDEEGMKELEKKDRRVNTTHTPRPYKKCPQALRQKKESHIEYVSKLVRRTK
jgi:hypothetical protein